MDTGYTNTQYCGNLSFIDFMLGGGRVFGKCSGQSLQDWYNSAVMQPPPMGAPSNALLLPPANGDDANATVTGVITAQMQDWQQSNSQYVQPVSTYGVPSGVIDLFSGNDSENGWLLALGALGVVAAISLLSQGSPSRYGR